MSENHPAYRLEPVESAAVYGRDKKALGRLIRKVISSDGSVHYYVIACSNHNRTSYVPLPLSIMSAHRNGKDYVAEVDHSSFLQAPQIPDIGSCVFDDNIANRTDAAFGITFPGIEAINDFA